MKFKCLMVPFDPVHDVGIRMIRRALDDAGHKTVLLPPDLPVEEIVKKATQDDYDFVMVSRTMGYGVAELLTTLIDLLDAAGVRKKSKIVIGGKAVTPQLAAELGFDKGFDANSTPEQALAYVENRDAIQKQSAFRTSKYDVTAHYSYLFRYKQIEDLLNEICEQTLEWASKRTSPGIQRAQIREQMLESQDGAEQERLLGDYLKLCGEQVAAFYKEGKFMAGTRRLLPEEIKELDAAPDSGITRPMHHNRRRPLIIFFTGSGCPVMDVMHNRIAAEWGVDGTIFICPSWVARHEGLLSGPITHEEDGTIPTLDNIKLVKERLRPNLYFQVRYHRGLNTPEAALYARAVGADFGKINPIYGSLNAGTDPERLLVDAIYAMSQNVKGGFPFDMPSNDELSGIPTYKCLTGMLITLMLGKKLGARPIMKPLFCYSPYAMVNGQMDNNWIDYNVAKARVLRKIVHAPIWPGEPVGFFTHEDDRCQSATTTALHAGLCAALDTDLVTVASTDESYSRGPIVISSRVDSFNAIRTMLRFLGQASFQPTSRADEYENFLEDKIVDTLIAIKKRGSLIDSLYEGDLGTRDEGANPGRAGRGTVSVIE
ncbi:MAG TPA: cobalamin B12-binding domain-containing protein [Candidatus Sumerlaeota bacterium]|nr:cobalamin B12-binding domain-containing protein [Candidatus Sumerlaeota bacterium]HRR31393.1 cobalamin B12-binding domain-containing protein [Candidatus Sumerlaeia bacterium]HON50276.1 cobalamin B12-binding domain-containing protein [Candidatus Sumerlaeota bacterium]HOR63492.1 cobalamin B12-binding domain-containing protein [Candidatus Sumerlaeota bacterium]HPL73458.1 cobalamin B12-binding domain-containing protein [Candidatus Sumerlaeota bacterium]